MKKDTIKADIMLARKNNDTFTVTVLSTLLGEVDRASTDTDLSKIVLKFINDAQFTIDNTNDNDTKIKLKKEIEILLKYAPVQMNDETLKQVILKFLETTPKANIGQVMKYLKENHNNQYNGKSAQTIIKELL